MKMKWNWGTKILVAMILFMLLLITLVFMSMRQTYHLVEKDYYPKALEYQGRIDKTRNAQQLAEKVKMEQTREAVVFTFPSFETREIEGTITFYRPSDEGMDVRFAIQPDTSLRQVCNVSAMPPGKYIVKLDYEVDGKGYYQEESVFLETK